MDGDSHIWTLQDEERDVPATKEEKKEQNDIVHKCLHTSTFHRGKYHCTICFASFVREIGLVEHFKIPGHDTEYCCRGNKKEKCLARYLNRAELDIHCFNTMHTPNPKCAKKHPRLVSEVEFQILQLQDNLINLKNQLDASESWKKDAQDNAEEPKELHTIAFIFDDSQEQFLLPLASKEKQLSNKVSQRRKVKLGSRGLKLLRSSTQSTQLHWPLPMM